MDPFYDAAELEFISALIGAQVDFVIVGGAAVQLYGYARPRSDLDVLWDRTTDNACRLRAVASHFWTNISDEDALQMTDTKVEFHLGGPYNFIHLLNGISGVEFTSAKQLATIVQTTCGAVPVISREHLIQSKLARGEEKDLLDIEALQRAHRKGTDGS